MTAGQNGKGMGTSRACRSSWVVCLGMYVEAEFKLPANEISYKLSKFLVLTGPPKVSSPSMALSRIMVDVAGVLSRLCRALAQVLSIFGKLDSTHTYTSEQSTATYVAVRLAFEDNPFPAYMKNPRACLSTWTISFSAVLHRDSCTAG